MGARDRAAVVAVAALPMAGATNPILTQNRIAGAAAAALRQAGEQVPRLGRDRAVIDGALGLPRGAQAEDVAVDNCQVRNLGALPLRFRVEAGYTLAGGRILDKSLPVPDQLANV